MEVALRLLFTMSHLPADGLPLGEVLEAFELSDLERLPFLIGVSAHSKTRRDG